VVQSRTNLEARKPAFGATLEAPALYRLTGTKPGGAGTQTGHTGYTDHTDSPVPPGVCL